MGDFSGSKGSERLAQKLAKLNPQAFAGVIAQAAAIGHETIVDKITSDVRPHNRDGKTVTDLVDTGAYRASWQISFPDQQTAKVATNVEYAASLEYGTEHMAGFFIARDVARQTRDKFKQLAQQKLHEELNK